jgi:uncharacterized membrane protein
MRTLADFFKSTLVGGLFVILPIGLLVLISLKIIGMIMPFAEMISRYWPGGLRFPALIAALLLLIVCFSAGLLARTRVGHGAGVFFENSVFRHVPGYSTLRSLARRVGDAEETDRFAPAFAEIEEALVPAFVVEEHADGRYTIFVPSAPTPAVGTIYVIDRHRVHLVDAPFLQAVKCVTAWGAGTAELVKAIRAPEAIQMKTDRAPTF